VFFAVVFVSLFGMMDLEILSTPTGAFPVGSAFYLLGDNQPVRGSKKVEVFEVEDIGFDRIPVESVDDGDHFFA
jgi:hypothetical protein